MADHRIEIAQGDPQTAASRVDLAHEPLKLGDPIPVLCNAHDLAHVFGRSTKTIYRWSKQGKLRRLELRRPIGDRRWSGKAVEAFADEHGFRSPVQRADVRRHAVEPSKRGGSGASAKLSEDL